MIQASHHASLSLYVVKQKCKPFIVSPFTLSQPTSAKLVNHFIKLLFGVENLSLSLPIWSITCSIAFYRMQTIYACNKK